MISVLLFTGLSLGIVCLVFTDCRANDRTPDAKKPSKDPAARD